MSTPGHPQRAEGATGGRSKEGRVGPPRFDSVSTGRFGTFRVRVGRLPSLLQCPVHNLPTVACSTNNYSDPPKFEFAVLLLRRCRYPVTPAGHDGSSDKNDLEGEVTSLSKLKARFGRDVLK